MFVPFFIPSFASLLSAVNATENQGLRDRIPDDRRGGKKNFDCGDAKFDQSWLQGPGDGHIRQLEPKTPHAPTSQYQHNRIAEDNADAPETAGHGPRGRRGHHEGKTGFRPVGIDFLRRIRRQPQQARPRENHRGINGKPRIRICEWPVSLCLLTHCDGRLSFKRIICRKFDTLLIEQSQPESSPRPKPIIFSELVPLNEFWP